MNILERLRSLNITSFEDFYNFFVDFDVFLDSCAKLRLFVGEDELTPFIINLLQEYNLTSDDIQKANNLLQDVNFNLDYTNLPFGDYLHYMAGFLIIALGAADQCEIEVDEEKKRREAKDIKIRDAIRNFKEQYKLLKPKVIFPPDHNQKLINILITQIGDLGLQLRRKTNENEIKRGTTLLNLAIKLRILSDNYLLSIMQANNSLDVSDNFINCLKESIFDVRKEEELTIAEAEKDIAVQKILNLMIFIDHFLQPMTQRQLTQITNKEALEALVNSLNQPDDIRGTNKSKKNSKNDIKESIKSQLPENINLLSEKGASIVISSLACTIKNLANKKTYSFLNSANIDHVHAVNYKDYRKTLEYKKTLSDLTKMIISACEKQRLPVFRRFWYWGGESITIHKKLKKQHDTASPTESETNPGYEHLEYIVPYNICYILEKISLAKDNKIAFEGAVIDIYKRLQRLCEPYANKGIKPFSRFTTTQEFYSYCKSYIEYAHPELCTPHAQPSISQSIHQPQ